MMKEEAEKYLSQVRDWKLVGDAIEKNYKFSNFRR
jgi:pterin-4a-carbinolamine dehydratase